MFAFLVSGGGKNAERLELNQIFNSRGDFMKPSGVGKVHMKLTPWWGGAPTGVLGGTQCRTKELKFI